MEPSWARDKTHLDVDGRFICMGDAASNLTITRPVSAGQSETFLGSARGFSAAGGGVAAAGAAPCVPCCVQGGAWRGLSFGFQVSGFGFRVLGFGLRDTRVGG